MGGELALKFRKTTQEANWMLQYYFTYCEAGFNTKTLGDVIITAAREGAMETMEEVPL